MKRIPQNHFTARCTTKAEHLVGNLFSRTCAWQRCGSMLHAHAVWGALTTPLNEQQQGIALRPLRQKANVGVKRMPRAPASKKSSWATTKACAGYCAPRGSRIASSSRVARRQQITRTSLESWSVRHGHCNEAELVQR